MGLEPAVATGAAPCRAEQGFVAPTTGTAFTISGAYDSEVNRTLLTARMNIGNVTGERYRNSIGNGLLGVGLPLSATFSLTVRL